MADVVRQDPVGLTEIISDTLGSAAPRTERKRRHARLCQRGRSQPSRHRTTDPAALRHHVLSRLDARLEEIRAAVQAGASHARGRSRRAALAAPGRVRGRSSHCRRNRSAWSAVRAFSTRSGRSRSSSLCCSSRFAVCGSCWSASLPSALSLLVVLGIVGFSGATLSAAAAGSAAMLFGLGVDGVVLLYVAHRLAVDDGDAGRRHCSGHRRAVVEHAPRDVDDGGDVLRPHVCRLPEPSATRPADRALHDDLRDSDAGARAGAASAIDRRGLRAAGSRCRGWRSGSRAGAGWCLARQR